MLDYIRRNTLSRSYNRNSRRIAHHELSCNASLGLLKRQRLILGIEGFLRRIHNLRLNIISEVKTARVLTVKTLDILKSSHKALNILKPVTVRDISKDITDIAEFNLDIVLVTQEIINLDARKTYALSIYKKLSYIKIRYCKIID